MSPYEHQPIIFNYGSQSKVISCPPPSIPDSILSARVIWCPIGAHIPSHSACCYSKGQSEVINGTHYDVRLEVGWEDVDPQAAVPLQVRAGCDIYKKGSRIPIRFLSRVHRRHVCTAGNTCMHARLTRFHTPPKAFPSQHRGQRTGTHVAPVLLGFLPTGPR